MQNQQPWLAFHELRTYRHAAAVAQGRLTGQAQQYALLADLVGFQGKAGQRFGGQAQLTAWCSFCSAPQPQAGHRTQRKSHGA